jgi:sulfate permease, SulP family
LKNPTNYVSALVVALVAMPLSIALGTASGVTPMMGLEAAIYGPFCTGVLGGSAYNIMGPAGALVNVLTGMTAVY